MFLSYLAYKLSTSHVHLDYYLTAQKELDNFSKIIQLVDNESFYSDLAYLQIWLMLCSSILESFNDD